MAPPPVQTAVKAVEEVPVVAPPKMNTPAAGPAHAVVEQNVRQEVKKVEKFAFTTRNEETGQQQVSVGQAELIYDEHRKSEKDSFAAPQGGAEMEKKEERGQPEQLRQRMEAGTAGQIVQAPRMARAEPFENLLKEKERQEAELVRAKEMLKLDKILPAEVVSARQKAEEKRGLEKKEVKKTPGEIALGPEEKMAGEAKKEPAPQLKLEQDVKTALDAALEQNRPALVVSAVLQKEQNAQFERSLLSVDERRLTALAHELDRRVKDGQIERMRLVGMMVKEQDLLKKRQIRLKLRKLQLQLAFYSRVRGMLGRLLGGFFGKLAGLKKLFK